MIPFKVLTLMTHEAGRPSVLVIQSHVANESQSSKVAPASSYSPTSSQAHLPHNNHRECLSRSLESSPLSNKENKAVPIYVGPAEAAQLEIALDEVKYPRPLTHDLMLDIITNLDAFVEKVEIYQLKGQMFFAHLFLKQHGRTIVLDARPSDAISLALRENAPLYIEEAIYEQAAVPLISYEKEEPQETIDDFKHFIDNISPDDFKD
jgi:hypothetical protein